MSQNLLANPGAETGDPSLSGNSSVSIPGWTVTGTPTVIKFGTPRNMWPVGLPFATPRGRDLDGEAEAYLIAKWGMRDGEHVRIQDT